jgi:hypothetical protein
MLGNANGEASGASGVTDIIAAEIADDPEAALAQFTKIAARLARTATRHE